MLVGMNLEEQIKYSNLDNSLKDEILDVIDNQVDKYLIGSELDESKVYLDDILGQINKIKSLMSTDNKTKQNIIDDIQEALIDLEDAESSLISALEYHHEKINDIKKLIEEK